MAESLFVVRFAWELLCDRSVDRLELVGAVAEREVRVVFPSIDDDHGVVAPDELNVPDGLLWGAGVEVGGVVIDRVAVEVDDFETTLASVENFTRDFAALRTQWMLWVGVLSGQTTSVRWEPVNELRDREGIQLVHTDTTGQLKLRASSMQTLSILRPGAGIGVLGIDSGLLQDAWQRATAGETPPLETELFHSAREAHQQRQARVGIMELGSAVETLLWQRYSSHTGTEDKDHTLGKLVSELGKANAIETSVASELYKLVDLRNRLVHHPEQDFFNRECLEAFGTALELFRADHPILFREPSPQGPYLIGEIPDHL